MKKYSIIILLSITVVALVSSCKKEQNLSPAKAAATQPIVKSVAVNTQATYDYQAAMMVKHTGKP